MIYEQFVTFTEQRGDQLYAHCPFHVDDTESMTVNPETGESAIHANVVVQKQSLFPHCMM